MTKVLVLYYSAYGHIETMAGAVAEGARSAGAEVTVKRVPELVPEATARAAHTPSMIVMMAMESIVMTIGLNSRPPRGGSGMRAVTTSPSRSRTAMR